MKVTRRTSREFVRQPWKNGGGTTTELAREGDGDAFLWRVSVAEVERSGPFSAFPGYERTILLLEGEGMELAVDGRRVRLDRPFEPFVFDGAAATTCTLLEGPCRDLNVIVDRRRARARMDVVENAVTIAAPCALVYVPGGDLTRIDRGEGERLALPERAILIQIDPREP